MPSNIRSRSAGIRSILVTLLILSFLSLPPALASDATPARADDAPNTESVDINDERGCDGNNVCTPDNETLSESTSPFQVGDTVYGHFPELGDPNKYWYKSTILGISPSGYHLRYEDDENEEEDISKDRVKPYVPPKSGDEVQLGFEDGEEEVWVDGKVVDVDEDGMYSILVTDFGEVLLDVEDNALRRVELGYKRKPKETSFTLDVDAGFHKYLNPKLFEDPQTMIDIGERLRNGDLVVIRDAFVPEFAEAMHNDLLKMEKWQLYEMYLEDGFNYHHHNVYDEQDYSEFMNQTFDLFDHPDSKSFMHELSGRDCDGRITASPSFYMPRDHSLPHSDFLGSRTVAFVWHLSKNWRPEWGGALYWVPENSYNAFQHASYNTLTLFSVSPKSFHFVTSVSPYAQEQRVTFNGWWNSAFMPTLDDPFEEMYATEEQRYDMSRDQWEWCVEVDLDDLPEERRERVADFQEELELWDQTPSRFVHTLEFE